mmetsp:Transcript_23882/g.38076  ORF Transcript_23882/g.38076 Transcript_23882/m.38076 type:complete len:307 (+) Transcript_23882:275-1195(+)
MVQGSKHVTTAIQQKRPREQTFSPRTPITRSRTRLAMADVNRETPNKKRRRAVYKPVVVKKQKIIEKAKEDATCGICFDKIEERGVLDCCEHEFCHECIGKWLERSCRCPHCKRVVSKLTKNSGESKLVARRELSETLQYEDDNEGDDMHTFMEHISVVARSLGLRLNDSRHAVVTQSLRPAAALYLHQLQQQQYQRRLLAQQQQQQQMMARQACPVYNQRYLSALELQQQQQQLTLLQQAQAAIRQRLIASSLASSTPITSNPLRTYETMSLPMDMQPFLYSSMLNPVQNMMANHGNYHFDIYNR